MSPRPPSYLTGSKSHNTEHTCVLNDETLVSSQCSAQRLIDCSIAENDLLQNNRFQADQLCALQAVSESLVNRNVCMRRPQHSDELRSQSFNPGKTSVFLSEIYFASESWFGGLYISVNLWVTNWSFLRTVLRRRLYGSPCRIH